GTAGWWPGSLGIGGSTAGTVGVQAGQVGVASQTMNVHADIVNVYGALGLPGTGPLGAGTGNFFSNLNPFSSQAFGGPLGIGGGGGFGAGGGGALASIAPYLGGAALLGLGLASKNPTAAILGGSFIGSRALGSLSNSGIFGSGVS